MTAAFGILRESRGPRRREPDPLLRPPPDRRPSLVSGRAGERPRRRGPERKREDDARQDAGRPPPPLDRRRLRRRGGTRRAPRDASESIGWVAPDLSLYGELTASENLRFFARLHGRPSGSDWADAAIAGVGLDPKRIAATPLRALSTGQRQRVKLVYATLHEPAVLFLDEPSSNLDEAGRAVVAGVVAAQRARGVAVVASNDPGDLALATERVTL